MYTIGFRVAKVIDRNVSNVENKNTLVWLFIYFDFIWILIFFYCWCRNIAKNVFFIDVLLDKNNN